VRARWFVALSLGVFAAAMPVIADIRDDEPVLRLRLTDPILDAAPKPFLRPRLSEDVTARSAPMPMPVVTLEEVGRVSKLAYISTPHPNLVVAVGATEDRSELGRQIDRAIMDMTPENSLYDMDQDSMPFIGFGLRAGQQRQGWAFDATVGAGLINEAETARLAEWSYSEASDRLEPEARAHVRLRYRF